MTRRPPSQGPRNLLKCTARQRGSRSLHPGLQGPDLELPGRDVGGYVKVAGRGEDGVGGLDGEGAGIAGFVSFAGRGGVSLSECEGGFGRGHCGRWKVVVVVGFFRWFKKEAARMHAWI